MKQVFYAIALSVPGLAFAAPDQAVIDLIPEQLGQQKLFEARYDNAPALLAYAAFDDTPPDRLGPPYPFVGTTVLLYDWPGGDEAAMLARMDRHDFPADGEILGKFEMSAGGAPLNCVLGTIPEGDRAAPASSCTGFAQGSFVELIATDDWVSAGDMRAIGASHQQMMQNAVSFISTIAGN
ncbi:MAG: hypothetical protein Q4G36_07305 [Paracoccus sp. (in: a-proteobacteria)]|nr:hypothetical protein [Paracoccus sp. (in: a-proteobacteria)]